ncbi:MAG: type II transport protein GspH [Halioglobus sp.]|nr:type II transport protein GspH [Halioglobus sp.]
MIVITILAVVLVVAVPGYQEMIQNNRQISEVYLLRSTLANARSEALTRREPVVVCPTGDGIACADTDSWGNGYMTFVDSDGDDENDLGEERIQWETRDTSVSVAFDNVARLVRFTPRGTALGFNGIFRFCDERGIENAKGLVLNAMGSVRAAADPNDPFTWNCQ